MSEELPPLPYTDIHLCINTAPCEIRFRSDELIKQYGRDCALLATQQLREEVDKLWRILFQARELIADDRPVAALSVLNSAIDAALKEKGGT